MDRSGGFSTELIEAYIRRDPARAARQLGLTPYLLDALVHIGISEEVFTYKIAEGTLMFDVSAAQRIVAQKPPLQPGQENWQTNVEEWYYGFIARRWIEVDVSYAGKVDLSRPLITAQMGPYGLMLIDGWHRVYRAQQDGVRYLPAYVLTEGETAALLYLEPEVAATAFPMWAAVLERNAKLKDALQGARGSGVWKQQPPPTPPATST